MKKKGNDNSFYVETPKIISQALINYINSLKNLGKNEIYETLIICMLQDKFLDTLESLIQIHIEKTKTKKNIKYIAIESSTNYDDAIKSICNSEYFIKNFSKEQIKRKKEIATNILFEIILPILLSRLKDGIPENIEATCNFQPAIFPTITHKRNINNGIENVQLTFQSDTPLNEIIKYLKEIVKIKNNTKKKKMSLWEGFIMLNIANDIKLNPKKYPKEPHVYTEQLISREMFKNYGKEISMEKVNKSLSRIKKIKKQINTSSDK